MKGEEPFRRHFPLQGIPPNSAGTITKSVFSSDDTKISPAVALQARIFVKVSKKRKCGRQLRLFGSASKAAPGLPCVRGLCFVCAVRHKRSSAIRAFILPRRADVPTAQAKRAHRKPAFIERVPGKSRMVYHIADLIIFPCKSRFFGSRKQENMGYPITVQYRNLSDPALPRIRAVRVIRNVPGTVRLPGRGTAACQL